MKPSSLRWRLRWLVIGVLAAVLVPLGVFSFRATLVEVGELSDARLAESARTLELLVRQAGIDALQESSDDGGEVPAARLSTIPIGGRSFEAEVAFQVVDRAGRVRMVTANFAGLPPPQSTRPGFADLQLAGYQWRTYTLVDARDGVTIRAGERYDSRHDITRALWLDHSLPLLLGLPLVALLVGWAVRRALRPLDRLAQTLSGRAPGSREPVELGAAPTELRPVIDALNSQFARLEDALERERRFSADVAHELRTPLTTSLISVESAMGSSDPDEVAAALDQTQQALTGLARRVEQLLALARLEAGEAADARVPVDLGELAMQVIEELAPLIADSRVELSLSQPEQPLVVRGHAAGLGALLRNLVENALRHVPGGGEVQVVLRAQDSAAWIEVIDNGPGIPPDRRAEVFARFHREAGGRGDGYGLGLSIVQRAAQMHGAQIELRDAPTGTGTGTGLCVRVVIPDRMG